MNCFSSKWTERSGDAGTITDNRSEAFTWYIMSLYHVLSLFSYRKQKIRDYLHEYQNIYYVGDLNDMMTSAIQFSSDEHGLTSILAIGKELGFEWNDIYYRFMTTYQV